MPKEISLPRPEYPRPQMVRDNWLNLNGTWEFDLDPGLAGREETLHEGNPLGRIITVPFCPESGLSGIGEKDFMSCVWYRRSFELPSAPRGRALLHFGASDYETSVWINGRRAGIHRGGYSSFHFEITHLVHSGENVIVVRAADNTRSGLQPVGKQSTKVESYGCHYTRTTGIWQTVWLEIVPEVYLSSLRLYPDIDQSRLAILAEIRGDAGDMTLVARASASGKNVGSARVSAQGPQIFDIDLSELHLWEPGSPFLYDLELSLEKGGSTVDRVKSYFGMRKVSIRGRKVLINNRPLFQRLVLDQGYYPDGIYTAPTDEALRRDIEISQALGFNGARLHQKVFEPRFLYWADRLGYLVWGEYPNWGLDHSHPSVLEIVLSEWIEVLQRDFNHPAIVGWCPFNETPGSQNPELLRNIYRATKAIDPTRPVLDTSGYTHVESEIYDCHNYEQDPVKFAAAYEPFRTGEQAWSNRVENNAPYQGQPYFVSEYGGIWWNPGQRDEKAWGYGARPVSDEEFIGRYRALTETLLFHPKMFAFCYTQLFDIEQEVNGLYTYERRAKFDPEIIRKINSQAAAFEKS